MYFWIVSLQSLSISCFPTFILRTGSIDSSYAGLIFPILLFIISCGIPNKLGNSELFLVINGFLNVHCNCESALLPSRGWDYNDTRWFSFAGSGCSDTRGLALLTELRRVLSRYNLYNSKINFYLG